MRVLTREEMDAVEAHYVDLSKPWNMQWKGISIGGYTVAATAEATRLEGVLTAAGKQPPKRPEYCHDDTRFAEDMGAYLAVLGTMASPSSKPISESASEKREHKSAGVVAPDAAPKTTVKRLTATQEILQAKGVGSLAELGGDPDGSNPANKLTATEEILQAKGVNSLDELEAKRAEERRAKSRGRTALLLLFLSLAFNVGAQDPKVYTLISGGTNAVPANSTNAAVVHRVDEYGDASLQASVAAPSGTSNLLFLVYRSADTETYESSPFTTLIAPSSSTTNTAITNFNVGAAASIKIVPANTNAGNYTTNVTLKIRFKAPKRKLQ